MLAEKKRTNKVLAEQLSKDPAMISKWVTNGATDKPCGVRTVANPKQLLNGT